VRQLDRKTGRVLWTATARQGAGKYFFHGDLLITPDLVIAAADMAVDAGGGSVHAFDRSTGQQRWSQPAGRGVAAALTGLDGKVFAPTLAGELWALDQASGERRWSFPLPFFAWEGPAVGDGRVFAGAKDGVIHALDAATGRPAWQVNVGAAITTSVARNGSTLYVGTADGGFHRVDARDGRVLSTRSLDTTLTPRSAPIVTNDNVFVLLADKGEDVRAVVALDRALNGVRWRVTAPDRWTTTRVFATPSLVVMGSPTGEVTAYCAADGTRAWSHTVKGTVRSIAGVDDILYVGTVEGILYAIRPPAACGKR
jgi:outer membrane protein assembly factor BamB